MIAREEELVTDQHSHMHATEMVSDTALILTILLLHSVRL